MEATVETSGTSLIALGLIDSPLKLHLLLRFYNHPRYCGDTLSLSEWLRENPWAIAEALEALAEAGFLGRIREGARANYRLEPSLEHWATLMEMAICYNDPLRREQIYALVRIADAERRFHAYLATEERELAYGC
jgi:hypothetical protein